MALKVFFRTLILLIFFSQCIAVKAQFRTQFAPLQSNNYFGSHFDDDFLFFGNRDEQYSGGFAFEYLTSIKKTHERRHLFNPFSNSQRFLTISMGGELYTPYNVSDSLIILNDRPYSSYLYSTMGYTAYSSNGDQKLNFDFYFGIMGSELPGKIQELVHTVGDSPPTYGWENRLMSEEVFIPNIRIHYQRNMLTLGEIKPSMFNWFQLTSSFIINTGYFANNIGTGFKANLSTALPNSPAKHTLNLHPFDAHYAKQLERKTIWNVYFSGQIELVGRNTSLQSLPWVNSPYVISRDLVNRHVWTLECGINMTHKRLYMTYYVRARSKEFIKYAKTWHSWASIAIGRSF